MDENTRMETLRKYAILDTPKDVVFDHITRLATTLLNIPISIISIVDTERIWFKSIHGAVATEVGREKGLCTSVILGTDLYIVEDARKDPRTKDNSLVTGDFGLQFYAGVPLTVKNGDNLGSLCFIDTKPRTLTADEQALLKDLAFLVVEQFEIQFSVRQSTDAQINMSNMLRSIYESTQEASTFIDTDLKIRYTNQVSKNLTKKLFGKEEQIGDDALDYVMPQYKDELKKAFSRVLKGERYEDDKTDGKNWWRISMYPVYDKNSSIVGLAHNVQDITVSKNNFLKLVKQNEVLKQIAWQQCHEVRGPLANILGFCDLLKDNSKLTEKEMQEYLHYLSVATKELDKIIHNIVDQSKDNNYDA